MNKRVLELAEPDSRAIEETACANMRCVMTCYELLRRILKDHLRWQSLAHVQLKKEPVRRRVAP